MTGTFVTSDEQTLFWHGWPVAGARASVIVAHGVGEHGGRYAGLAADLEAGGIGTFAFDQRGHGRSGGPRAHVDRWARYEADLCEIVEHLVSGPARGPFFVYGHSMGALVCLTLAASDPWDRDDRFLGCIVSGAGLRPTGIAKPHLVAIARLLSRVAPRVRLDLGIAAEALSHEPEVREAYDRDPLVVRKATVRWGTEALDAIASVERDAGRIRQPLLILHGGSDPLAEAAGSRWLHASVAGPSELIVYDGALHEPHNDPGYADVATDVTAWIDGRLEEAA